MAGYLNPAISRVGQSPFELKCSLLVCVCVLYIKINHTYNVESRGSLVAAVPVARLDSRFSGNRQTSIPPHLAAAVWSWALFDGLETASKSQPFGEEEEVLGLQRLQ